VFCDLPNKGLPGLNQAIPLGFFLGGSQIVFRQLLTEEVLNAIPKARQSGSSICIDKETTYKDLEEWIARA